MAGAVLAYLGGHDRSQLLFLPQAMDEKRQRPRPRASRLAEMIGVVWCKHECHKALLEELDCTGECQITTCTFTVDTKHKLIAEQEVHSRAVDMGLLAATAMVVMEAPEVER